MSLIKKAGRHFHCPNEWRWDFYNRRGWWFSFCCFLVWGISSATLQIHFKHALTVLAKEVYCIREFIVLREFKIQGHWRKMLWGFSLGKNTRNWKVYCVGIIVQYSSIALFLLLVVYFWHSISSLCGTPSLLKFWRLITIIKQEDMTSTILLCNPTVPRWVVRHMANCTEPPGRWIVVGNDLICLQLRCYLIVITLVRAHRLSN